MFTHRTLLLCCLSSIASCSHHNSFLSALAARNMDSPYYLPNFAILCFFYGHDPLQTNDCNIIVREHLIFIHPSLLPCDIFLLKKQTLIMFKRWDISEATFKTMNIRLQNRRRFLYAMAIVCFILIFSFLPSLRFMTYRAFHPTFGNINERELSSSLFKLILTVFLSFNFAINPVIYVWRLPKYRKTFKSLYCKYLRC